MMMRESEAAATSSNHRWSRNRQNAAAGGDRGGGGRVADSTDTLSAQSPAKAKGKQQSNTCSPTRAPATAVNVISVVSSSSLHTRRRKNVKSTLSTSKQRPVVVVPPQSQPNDDDDDDPLGEALTHVLNHHPAWNYTYTCPRQRMTSQHPNLFAAVADQEDKEMLHWSWPLLFSRHSIWLLHSAIRRIIRRRKNNKTFQQQQFSPPPSISTLFRIFGTALLAGGICVAVLVTTTALYGAQYIMTMIITATPIVMSLLLTSSGSYSSSGRRRVMVSVAAAILQGIHNVFRWLDFHILLGQRWYGREWNHQNQHHHHNNEKSERILMGSSRNSTTTTTHIVSVLPHDNWNLRTASARSQRKRLWEYPPPSLMLSPRANKNTTSSSSSCSTSMTLWSDATVQHRVGIQFCYLMIRKDDVNHNGTALVQYPHYHPNRQHSYACFTTIPAIAEDEEEELDEEDDWTSSYRSKTIKDLCNDLADIHTHHPHQHRLRRMKQSSSSSSSKQQRSQQRLLHYHTKTTIDDDEHDDAYALEKTPYNEQEWNRRCRSRSQPSRRRRNRRAGDGHCPGPEEEASSSRVIASDEEEEGEQNEEEEDLPWIDVTAKIGMRLLNSTHVHRVMTDPTLKNKLVAARGAVTHSQTGSHHHSMMHPSKTRHHHALTQPFLSLSSSPPQSPPSPQSQQNRPLAMDTISSSDSTDPRHHRTSMSSSIVSSSVSSSRRPNHPSVKPPVHSIWASPPSAASHAHAAPLQSRRRPGQQPSDYAEDHVLLEIMQSSSTEENTTAGRMIMQQQQQPTKRLQPHLQSSNALQTRSYTTSYTMGGGGSTRKRTQPPLSTANANIEVQLHPNVAAIHSNVTDNDDEAVDLSSSIYRLGARASSPTNATIVTQTFSIAAVYQRPILLPGVKVAVPLSTLVPYSYCSTSTNFQMGTVVRSRRLYVGDHHPGNDAAGIIPNCLSVTVKLDQFYLRNADFAELSFRVMDVWTSDRYMPRHSKVPIGSCVATTFGLGVVVGWRVQDDIHVVRSLWQRRGQGSGNAYLQSSAIHSVVEAVVGFEVKTKYGAGITLAYVDGGPTFESGRFFVAITEIGRYHGHVIEMHRRDVYSCLGAQFIPVIEHIREAALYKIQMDNYKASLRDQNYDDSQLETDEEKLWKAWPSCLDVLWNSFLKVVDEDNAFDEGVNEFMTSIIDFLERLDMTDSDMEATVKDHELNASDFAVECTLPGDSTFFASKEKDTPGLWVINDILGGVLKPELESASSSEPLSYKDNSKSEHFNYERIYSILRIIMKTVSLAKVESVDHPNFRMALTISYDVLLVIRNIVKVQQKNSSHHSLEVWKQAIEEIILTFGPLKDRLAKIGRGIAQRMERHGKKAKTRVLQFVDTLLGDEKLLFAMEQGDWGQCLSRLETALVKSKIILEQSLFYYRKTGQFIVEHLKLSMSSGGGAATRNNEKLAFFAQCLRSVASPQRSILRIFLQPAVLDLLERILVRVYILEEGAPAILNIHASSFTSLRHFRLLKDVSVSGKMWIPVLDSADEEFSSVVSQLPENSKELMLPLSRLFSLCVEEFRKISSGDLSKHWLDFLLRDDAVDIIHEIDMKLILALEQISQDVREMIEVLPYYPSIDVDILKLMDEVNLDEFLKEASTAIDNPESLAQFFREKVTIAIERFLNYLPKLSIPVERRDIGDGWVITCRSEDGSDLSLSDVRVKRENLICQILGGNAFFFPMFCKDDCNDAVQPEKMSHSSPEHCDTSVQDEESILDHIRGLLQQAQKHGCWTSGVGGVGEPSTDRYVASVLHDLPMSSLLNTAIELWRNLEIDDDELLEIAIRDVSFQIQLQQVKEDGKQCDSLFHVPDHVSIASVGARDYVQPRFNPRIDSTVLFLEMKNLTLNLENFLFRIEKSIKRTIIDPVFEGHGSIMLENINICLRLECAKERVKRSKAGGEVLTPILRVQELTVKLENIQLRVKDTGFGSDWLLNHAVQVFGESITKVVEENLREQILEQFRAAIDKLNSYFSMNPNLLLNLLGVSINDLEEHVVFV